jgi:hypothetical protein
MEEPDNGMSVATSARGVASQRSSLGVSVEHRPSG